MTTISSIAGTVLRLVSAFMPGKDRRKEFRNRFVKASERRKALTSYGCQLAGDIATSPQGIHFDISDYAKITGTVSEVLIEEVYNFSARGEMVVIDIGMNRGLASLYFASKANVSAVYAFEPFVPTYALAQQNLALNPELHKKIQSFQFGLANADAELVIPYAEKVSHMMSTTHPPPEKPNLRNEKVIVKDAAAILGPIFERHRGANILIKCDCEGAEFEIMERLAEAGLVRQISGVLMEYHFQAPDKLVQILTTAGFAVNTRRDANKKNIIGLLYAVNMGQT